MRKTNRLKKQIEAAQERLNQLQGRLEKQYAGIGELYITKKELETGAEVDLEKLQKELEEEIDVLRELAKEQDESNAEKSEKEAQLEQ